VGATRIIGIVGAITVTVVGTTRWRAVESPSDWRARFTQAALQIPFDNDVPPERDSMLPRDARMPEGFSRFRMAAARTRDTSRAGGIGVRITSDTGYPRLGIAPGVNYVWKDVTKGKTRLLIIPADTAKPVHWLVVTSHLHPTTRATSRFIIGVDAKKLKGRQSGRALYADEAWICIECKDDPMTWCKARDTVDSKEAMSAPVSEITRYFARNHVVFLQR
jgi:hypothetical protein